MTTVVMAAHPGTDVLRVGLQPVQDQTVCPDLWHEYALGGAAECVAWDASPPLSRWNSATCLHAFGTRGAHPAPATLCTRPAGARALSAPHLETTKCHVVVPINDTD